MDEPDAEGMRRLLAENRVVVVDYYATWCLPCKGYSPKFARLEREMRRARPEGGFAFVSVDVDRHQDLARQARVLSVPTTVAWTLKKGLFGTKPMEVLRFSGDRPWPDLVRLMGETLEKHAR